MWFHQFSCQVGRLGYLYCMAEQLFRFKQFTVRQDRCAMKIGTDGMLLGAWAQVPPAGRVLDIGTGTGVVALMLAQRSGCTIDAVEVDADAAQQAGENFAESPWAGRLRVVHTALQDYQPAHQYDLMACNPPYFDSKKGIVGEGRTLARHNAHLPLTDLLDFAAQHLLPNGSLAVVLPAAMEEQLLILAEERTLYPHRILKVKGTPNAEHKRVLMQLGFDNRPCKPQELTIELARHQYTEEYQALTRDFYLKM